MTPLKNLPQVGEKAPDFTLPNQDGNLVSLNDLQSNWLILYFYPKDDTPGCTTEAKEFTDLSQEFNALGAKIVGVSPDTEKSHGANSPRTDKSRFQLEFDWMGTDDPTAYMCVPEAIAFLGSLLPGGWDELRQRNHQLALQARQLLCETLEVLPPCPEEMIGSMAVLPIPNALSNRNFLAIRDELFDRFNIQVQIVPWQETPKLLVRISAQIYNRIEEYKYLGKALKELIAESGG